MDKETLNSDEKKKGHARAIVAKTASKSSAIASAGASLAKKGAVAAKGAIVKTAGTISESGKKVQKSVINYVDKKKNAKFLKTKMSSFEDGIKQGKVDSVELIKKYANYYLAATALSFFFARCDGEISEEEVAEIQFDLNSIMKNKDLPVELQNKLNEISNSPDISFDEVRTYLDGVGIDTVLEFQKDIDEIIFADGVVNEAEQEAKFLFDEYLKQRVEEERE